MQLVLLVIAGILAAQPTAATRRLAQQQQPFITITISEVQTSAQNRYTWSVTNTADKDTVSAPVGSSTGTGQVRFTVSFKRSHNEQPQYVLSGSLVLQAIGTAAHVVQPPVVTLTPQSGRSKRVPKSGMHCPSLTVGPADSLSSQLVTCTFHMDIPSSSSSSSGSSSSGGRQPSSVPGPGKIRARVVIPGSGITVRAPAVNYDFAAAVLVDVGAQATIGPNSGFDQGAQGFLPPFGVSGDQPQPGTVLQDSTEYSYLALFGNVDAALCGRQWTAVNTAEVVPVSPSTTREVLKPVVEKALVAVNLVGCSTSRPGFAATEDSPADRTATAAAVPTTPPTTPPSLPGPAEPASNTPPAPLDPSAAASLPAVPPGLEQKYKFAAAGSTMCGGGVCDPTETCFDGWHCCAKDIVICGGVCCDGGRVCIQDQCVPQGSAPCGSKVCVLPDVCGPGDVCCPSTRKPCGTSCCDDGQDCVLVQCVPSGSTECSNKICAPTERCVGAGVCCPSNLQECNGQCCDGTCLQNQCVPVGSTLCAGGICQPPLQCASGTKCCPVGSTVCGGDCCPTGSGSTCLMDRCLPVGSSPCPGDPQGFCGPGLFCQSAMKCCNVGEKYCNNGCCPQGTDCINNQCAPTGSRPCGPNAVCQANQFCGNEMTGTCCQMYSQIPCGNTCCPSTQQCNTITQQCIDPSSCGPLQVWCPAANQCCDDGLCSPGLNRCLWPGERCNHLGSGYYWCPAAHRCCNTPCNPGC